MPDGMEVISASGLDTLLKTQRVFARAKDDAGAYLEGGRVFAIVGIYFLHRQVILCDKDTLQPPVVTAKLDNIEVVGFRALTA